MVGGLWTIFTFVALQPAKEAEARLFEQAVVEIAVEAKQLRLENNRGLFIEAVATVKNIGNRNTSFDFRNPPFRITKIEVGRDKQRNVSQHAEVIDSSAGLTLRRTASSRYHLLYPVAEPGYYLVEFSVPLSETEMALHQLAGVGLVYWRGSTTVVVSTL